MKFEALPEKYQHIFSDFTKTYTNIAGEEVAEKILSSFLEAIALFAKEKPPFEHFHKALRTPIDFYGLGLDLFRPLIDSYHLLGADNVKRIREQWSRKENIFLFANHQSEADPQLLSLLLEKQWPDLAEEIIFVAGERVVTDPLAVPMSWGRNLLCIYSKKYFDVHKERKTQMLEHNKKAIQILAGLLDEGGKCIYIAPSGGRDRPNEKGLFTVAPFDPQSVQLCRLLGTKAKKPTHFYPLALHTHRVLPPPEGIQAELGEKRSIYRAPIGAAFGEEITFPSYTSIDKEEQKQLSTKYVWELVNNLYEKLT